MNVGMRDGIEKYHLKGIKYSEQISTYLSLNFLTHTVIMKNQ